MSFRIFGSARKADEKLAILRDGDGRFDKLEIRNGAQLVVTDAEPRVVAERALARRPIGPNTNRAPASTNEYPSAPGTFIGSLDVIAERMFRGARALGNFVLHDFRFKTAYATPLVRRLPAQFRRVPPLTRLDKARNECAVLSGVGSNEGVETARPENAALGARSDRDLGTRMSWPGSCGCFRRSRRRTMHKRSQYSNRSRAGPRIRSCTRWPTWWALRTAAGMNSCASSKLSLIVRRYGYGVHSLPDEWHPSDRC